MNFKQIISNDITGWLMIAVLMIITFGIVFFIFEIYEKFFGRGKIIKISDPHRKLGSTQIIKKVVIKDANDNIISEKFDGVDEDILRQIEQQTMNRGIYEDSTILNKNGDFSFIENFEDFKKMMNNDSSKFQVSASGTMKTFSGEMPEKLKKDFEKYGDIKIIKDKYGNTIVEDAYGNVLEGDAKREALEASKRRERFFSGSRVKETKINGEEIEEIMKSNGISIGNDLDIEKIEEMMKNNPQFNNFAMENDNVKEVRKEIKDRQEESVIEYNTDEDDDIGIKRY